VLELLFDTKLTWFSFRKEERGGIRGCESVGKDVEG
jgi:hypothetical protein